ncbi:MAG TPA: RNA polymerase sigma-70 factor [Flavisolibacter sp.]|jgi:RNA polymerase sigma-70 factor (ECF subfamily)|nr:RNA polymerase sigma-70 factor [Flavisolibacter sp.]
MIAASALTGMVEKIAVKDDLAAYKQLFIHYHSKLTKFSYSILGNKETAEEVVSDVFLKIWNNRHTLTNIRNFHLYLYICTKNQTLNSLRSQNRNKSFSLDDCNTELTSFYFDPEQLMITQEMYKRIDDSITNLPPKCRLIFKLIREDGLNYKEVSQLLQLSVKTIENQMTIALKKIGQSIQFDIKKAILF